MFPQIIVLSAPVAIATLLIAVLLGFAQWRASVVGVLFLMVLEGALRKWLFTDSFGGATIYFLKDALLLGAYLRFIFYRRDVPLRLAPLPWRGVLIVFVAYAAIDVLNPGLPNLALGLMGFKAFLFYVPLLWLVPAAIQSPQKAVNVLRAFAYMAVPVMILGFVQYRAPMDSPLVRYLSWSPSEVGQIATMGDRVRVAATFAFVSGYALYLFVLTVVAGGIALQDFASKRPSAPFLAFIAIGAVVSILITGSRWPLAALAIALVALVNSGVISGRARVRVAAVTISAAALAIVASTLSSTVLDRFVGRVTTADSFGGRVEVTITKPFAFMPLGGAFGFGTGATHQTARVIVQDHAPYDWLPTDDFEQEPARVVLELGVVGFALYYGLRLMIVVYAWRLQRGAPRGTVATSSIVAMVQLAMLTASVAYDAQACLYVWYFAGIARMLDGYRRTYCAPVVRGVVLDDATARQIATA